ncbi:MAG TPA: Hsp20/alpha crystallin family protein [Alphaproteobacteria bacterium]|jgi:HSP20 family protein|nr:Hsp20/alpha crystallin family protein [Alphaproteobacteria bacterium]
MANDLGPLEAPLAPFGWPFRSLQKEVNRVFRDFFEEARVPELGFAAGVTPGISVKMDIAETDKAFEVTAEMPGMDEKDIELSVSDGILTIKGEKKAEKEEKGKNYHRIERSYGSFQRSLALPPTVNVEAIDATFKKGVLTITLPKTAKAVEKAKKIEVKAS